MEDSTRAEKAEQERRANERRATADPAYPGPERRANDRRNGR